MSREPAPPPVLEGLVFQRVLGSGGFADVYLYEQQLPKMLVAVKVLDSHGLDERGRSQFTAEANAMARVADHPAIVPILRADIAADGRPYLVMSYYPGDNLGVRARTGHLNVPEVLTLGVQLAGAVETAHRAGILHRDIKPSNILVSPYGEPGLIDFGIAATKADDGSSETADAMSVPWAPPEVVDGSGVADERSDVYSMAATVYTLLAGRSPFEVPGGANSALDLMHRIRTQPVPRVGRDDVPESLDRLLAQAMAKSPADRPATAAAFGRGLQAVELEMQLKPTRLVVPETAAPVVARTTTDADATNVRPPVRIDTGSAPAPVAITSVPGAAPAGPSPAIATDAAGVTRHRADPAVGTPDPSTLPDAVPPSSPRRPVVWLAVAAAVVLVLAVGAVTLLRGQGSTAPSARSSAAGDLPAAGGDVFVDSPELSVTRRGAGLEATWSAPEPGQVVYLTVTTPPGAAPIADPGAFASERTSFVIAGAPAGTCVTAQAADPSGARSVPSKEACG